MGAMNELTQVIWLIAPAAVLLFLGVYFVGQAGAVRRTLLSTLLLEQMSALIRLGLPLRRGLEPCEREIGRASRRDSWRRASCSATPWRVCRRGAFP